MKSIGIIAVLYSMICITSCKKETQNTDFANSAVCSGSSPTYTSEIASILNTNCATSGCHSANAASAGINLSNFSNASNQFKNNSRNLASVHHASGVAAMPQASSKLPAATINKLDCWVKNGCQQ